MGWSIGEISQCAPSAEKDVYGSLFFYLRKLLLRFCRQIRNSKVEIQLFQADALKLPDLLSQRGTAKDGFDRIEVCCCILLNF